MKLKYYLRGIGIGVIVATLIMTVSSVIHNNNLSDETIIKEAQKLGMVMPENTEDKDSLWGSDTESESESSQMEDSQSAQDSQTTEDSLLTEDSQTSENIQSTEADSSTEDVQQPVDDTMAVVVITDSDAARHVSEKLQAAGLIEDAVEFRNYLADKGYARDIISGTFQIPKGSSYAEICNIIIKK